MELYEQILCRYFDEHRLEIIKNEIESEFDKIVISECYKALKQIKEIIDDCTLDDPECFMRIERIVRVFEEMGCDCGGRHDFG